MEEYRKCFEDYEISNFGNCRRLLKDGTYRNVKGSIMNKGYRYFQVGRKGKRQNFLFHQMVAKCFIGERPNLGCKVDIDHIDRNKLNNRLDNLRYVSHEENMKNQDRYRDDIKEQNKKKRACIITRKNEIDKIQSKIYYCSLCEVAFSSPYTLNKHNNGNRHNLKQKYKIEMEKHNIEWNKKNYNKCKSANYEYKRGRKKPIVYIAI